VQLLSTPTVTKSRIGVSRKMANDSLIRSIAGIVLGVLGWLCLKLGAYLVSLARKLER
jgi:hypothetical protein